MIDITEIKSKLIDKLRDSGWDKVLKAYIFSDDFTKIIKDLELEVDNGRRFTPQLRDVFRCFEECKWDDLKVVMLGQDPYPQLGVATGLAFDCSYTGKLQPSLRFMEDAINKTVYNPIPEPYKDDITDWAHQGILLLNTALTTQLDKPLTHQRIWQSFIAYILDTISSNKKDIVFVFLGKTAQNLEDLVSDDHPKYIVSHPASAAHSQLQEWDSKNVFVEINKELDKNGKGTIKW